MSNQNDWLLLTGGDEDDISFYVLDIKTKDIVYKKTKQKELESLPPEKGRPLFRPFGISTDKNFIYLASNDKIGLFDKNSYEFVKILNIPAFVNTHQVLIHNNLLFVCHTAINCIGIHNLNTNQNKFLKLPSGEFIEVLPVVSDVYEHDTVHVNSLHIYGNKLFFCLHYRGQKKSRYGYFDLESENVNFLFDAGMCSHNIVIRDNLLFSVSTMHGNLIQYDLESKKISEYNLADPKKVFLRGLEIYGDGLIYCGSRSYTHGSNEINPYLGFFDLKNKTSHQYWDLKEPKYITDCCWINDKI